MDDRSALALALGVQDPWQVSAVAFNRTSNALSVRIEQPPPRQSLFNRKATSAPAQVLRFEHLPVAGQRCRIVLALRPGQAVPQEPWAGGPNETYSHGLRRLILDLLLAGATIDQLCVLLKLPFADLWRYKFHLDQGMSRPTSAGAAAERVTPQPRASRQGVPPPESPVWAALLLGRLKLDVRMLGLRLLLTKLQRDAALHGDADLHRQAAQELHRYFQRSQAVLQHELSQLHAAAPGVLPLPAQAPAGAPKAVPADGARPLPSSPPPLPDPSDPLWLSLLEGRQPLDVRVLGLRLLLTKLRSQLQAIHDQDVRMVKLVELHRFFTRHQAALGHEIAQIRALQAH